jgi:hypothetical protein
VHCSYLPASRIVAPIAKKKKERTSNVRSIALKRLLTAAENRKHFRAWMAVWLQAIALLERFNCLARS